MSFIFGSGGKKTSGLKRKNREKQGHREGRIDKTGVRDGIRKRMGKLLCMRIRESERERKKERERGGGGGEERKWLLLSVVLFSELPLCGNLENTWISSVFTLECRCSLGQQTGPGGELCVKQKGGGDGGVKEERFVG